MVGWVCVCLSVYCCGVAVLKNYNNTAIKYIRFINIFSTISFISFHFLSLFSQYNTRIKEYGSQQRKVLPFSQLVEKCTLRSGNPGQRDLEEEKNVC